MDMRIIKHPSKGTIDILYRRKGSPRDVLPENIDAIGLVQGKVIEMIVASDAAQKSVDVTVEDIKGNCPQHMIMLAIFGETAAVETAMSAIKDRLEETDFK
jgi:ethanolamine utilization microcompartment shell protein EutS